MNLSSGSLHFSALDIKKKKVNEEESIGCGWGDSPKEDIWMGHEIGDALEHTPRL
jgi:hypothetical protein